MPIELFTSRGVKIRPKHKLLRRYGSINNAHVTNASVKNLIELPTVFKTTEHPGLVQRCEAMCLLSWISSHFAAIHIHLCHRTIINNGCVPPVIKWRLVSPIRSAILTFQRVDTPLEPVSYTHLTLPTTLSTCRSRWSPYH